MKILFYRYGSICEPDIIEAMKHLGHEVFSINLEITDKNIQESSKQVVGVIKAIEEIASQTNLLSL